MSKLLHSPDFIAAHRTHDKVFTRQRVLTFPVVVSFLLCAFKGSLQTRLDDLFATLDGTALRSVTKSAVSQARQKLKATAFEALNDGLTGLLSELLPEPRGQGLRLVATDSTAPCVCRPGRKIKPNSGSNVTAVSGYLKLP